MKEGISTGLITHRRQVSPWAGAGCPRAQDDVRNRISELDVVRGLAIFGVLVIHSGFRSRFSDHTMAIQAVLARLFDWAVPAFFFSSGFLYTRSASFTTTFKKRFMSLMVPFFLYNALYNLCFAGAEALNWIHLGESQSYSRRLATGMFQSPAFQLYFLPYLFMISIGICGLDKLNRRYYEWGYRVILASALGFYIWHGYPAVSHGPAIDKLPLYLAAFLVGVMGKPFLEKKPTSPWMVGAALGALLCSLTLSRLPFASVAVPPFLMGMAGAIPKIANSKLLLSMGVMSGSIYLWHTPLMLPAFTRILVYFGVPSLFVLFGSMALALAACMFLRYCLDRFFIQVLRSPTPRIITL